MRNLRRNLSIVTLLALLVAVPATILSAQEDRSMPLGHGMGHGPGGGEPGRMLERMVRHLDLSDEQTSRVEQIFQDGREQNRPLRERADTAHEAFAELMWADELDETALREAATALAEAQTELRVAHALAFRDLRDVLDEEQLATLAEFHEQRMERRASGGHGHGFGGHP